MMKEKNGYANVTIESIFRNRSGFYHRIIAGHDLARLCTRLFVIITCASACYGLTMGMRHSAAQAASSAVKVPILFLATLSFCIPTLHFIGLLLGSRVRFPQTLSVLLLGIAITSVLLASFAPISLFFLLTGSRYQFMMIMHVLIFAFCGAAGLISIKKGMDALLRAIGEEKVPASQQLLTLWMMLYMFVGTQMAYVLSPFVGKFTDFLWMHKLEGNFYSEVWEILRDALSKGI